MAEKKSWRDYTSGGTEAKEDKSDKKTSSWRDYVNPTAVVGKSVTEQLNNWLTNHNSYISEYQKRSEGRKYTYEDAYVGDSADWLKSETERRNALNNEANSILSYLDQYGGHLDPKILEEVRMTINRAKDTQYQIHTIATQDNEWWNSFNDEELVKKYGSAEGAYNYYQRADGYNKKYTGMTSDELSSILDSMEDGEEKDWLTSYASSVDYEEKKNLDIDAYAKEIEDFADFGDEALTINVWYNDYMAGREPADAHKLEVYNRFMNEYGGDFNAIKTAYSQMNARMNVAKRIQEGAKLAGVADPTSEFYDPEFAQYSQYVDGGNTPLLPFYSDIAYDFANGKGSVADIAGGKQFAMVSSFDLPRLDAISRMNKDERAIYNYYHSKHGHEAAEEYLDSIIEVLNYRTGEDYFAPMKGNPVLETAFGFVAGLDQFGSGIANLFNGDDYIPTSAVQYTSGMVRDDLKDTGFKLPDWMGGASLGQAAYDGVTTIANMAPSILASTVVGTINPAAGAAVGSVLMGASATGNAYQEALNLGYDKGQARAYSTLVGASETGLQYLMGGIGKLGSKISGKAAASLASKFDNAFARLAVKYGTNMLQEGAEEYLQEILTPVFKNLALKTDEEVNLITEDAIYSFLLGAVTSGVMEGPGTTAQAVQMLPFLKSNRDAVKTYGTYGEDGAVPALIESGLESPTDSESHRLAQIAERKTNRGKKLSGYEIRQLVSENQKQITAEILADTKTTAEKRLTELGESQNVSKIAELVAKRATGQEMTRSEISTLARSQYGAQVAKEMRQEVNGTKDFDTAYKSLEDRVDNIYTTSESGQATVHDTNEAIDLSKLEVVDFVKDEKTGKVTDMVIKVDGKEVRASDIGFADDSQSYLFSAVQKIENITPGDAQVIIRDYDPASGQTVGEYLNGVDEAFTYGYYNYPEADLKAGNFTGKLTDTQMKSAYVLGQNAKNTSKAAKSDAIKLMRTAVMAEAEKATAEGKKAPKSRDLTITYNDGKGKVVDFDKAGLKLTAKQKAAPAIAKIMHEMGLGTNFELFASYVNKDGVRVFLDENGVEQKAYSGVYRMKDGTVRIDINAYNGRGLTLNAMAHELTHFIQQWSTEKYEALADFLMKTYEKTGMTMHERVLREQARLKRTRGEEISYDEAHNEVVANAMSKMLDDGKVMERLNELMAVDMDLAQKLWQGLKKLLNKFFRVYEKESALFYDAADLMELKAEFEQMQKMWAEAFVEASENYQASLTVSESQSLADAGKEVGDQQSSQETDVDTEADSAYDSAKKETKQEVIPYGQDGKAEDHASFIRRMHEGSRRVKQIGNITYAFHALRVLEASNAATEARRELRRLGIKCFLHNGLEYNQNGYTYQDTGVAATLADGSVGLYGKSYGDGIEYAGHEAFHVWKHSTERDAYVETLRRNIDITSSVYGIEQADTVLRAYFDGNVEALAKEEAKAQFQEELYALVSGKIHSGSNEAGLKTMFKDYAAVKTAWDDLIKKQAKDALYSSQETDRDFDGKSYAEIEEERQKLFQRERELLDRKRAAESNPELLQAMDDYSVLFDEARTLFTKRHKGTATQAELNRIEEIKALKEERLNRVSELQESLGLSAMEQEMYEVRAEKEALRIAADEAWAREGAEKENKAIEKSGMSAPEYFRKKALKSFKTTTNFNEAGYLLPDGKLLDFSGGERNHRYRDHREIGEIYEATQGAAALNRFLSDGNIRIMAESPGIDLASSVEPTKEQYAELRRFINTNGTKDGQFFVDFSGTKGEIVGKYAYNGKIVTDRIINDIRYFYQTGEIRESSGLTDFLYSSQETDADGYSPDGFKDYDIVSAVYTIRNEKAKRGHDLVKIGNMPTLYRKLFGLSGKVYVSNEHLYQNMVSRTTAETEGRFNPDASADYHDLGEEKIITAIEQFQDPLVIMESLKDFKEPRLVAILDEKGNDGENLIAVLELYAPLRPHGASQLRNHVLITIYEKNSLPGYIEETVDKDRVLYKKEGSRLTSQAGLRLAGEMSNETLKRNVARFNKKVKAFKEENKIYYSGHETDDISNRDLLANAFEGITKSSPEYELIQQYKGRIRILNEYEEKLAKLNAEIRKLTFGTEGQRDTQKLKQLQTEAKKVAEDINRNDKKLLSLEASEPLRKVIERERKKEAQKNKDHVKEIQQNKKVRAEQAEKERVEKAELRRKVRADESVGAAPAGFDPVSTLQYEYGSLPEGEKPMREDSLPKSTNGKDKVSLTARTVKGAAATPDHLIDLLDKTVVEGGLSYIPLKNSATVQKAYDRIVKIGWEEALRSWSIEVRSGKVSAEITTTGALLLNNAANAGDKQTWLDILHDYQIMSTNAGQAVQALRILKTLAPEDKLYMIHKSVDQMNKDSGYDVEVDEDLLHKWDEAETDAERDEVLEAIMQNVADQVPSTFMEKFTALRYVNMLGNLRTQVRNVAGNLSMKGVRSIHNSIATGLEAIVNQVSGGKTGRTRSITVSKEQKAAAKNDFEKLKSVILDGGKYSDSVDASTEFAKGVQEKRRIFKFKPLEGYRKATNWAMEQGDLIFARDAYARALAGYLKANGITETDYSKIDTNVLDDARLFAIMEAQEATFRDTNALSGWISKMGRRRDTHKVGKLISEGVMPFRKTPANVLIRAWEYSPLGVINSVYYSFKAMQKGTDVTATQVINSWAKSLTGTGLFALGMLLQGLGCLTGGADDDENKDKFDSMNGWQNYAIVLPDGTNLTIDFLTPTAMPMLMGAELNQLMADGGFELKDLESALASITEPMVQMSMLQGVNDALDDVKYSDNSLMQIAINSGLSYLTQGLTNTWLGQIERAFEDSRTTTYVDKGSGVPDWLQRTIGKASAKIPGFDYNQIPYINAWGEEEKYGNVVGNLAYNMLSPSYTDKGKEDAVSQELIRLNEVNETGRTVFPSTPEKKITFTDSSGAKHKNYDLTADEYVALAKEQGQTQRQIVESMLKSELYADLSDKNKAKAVQTAYDYAREYAQIQVLDRDGFSSQWMADLKGDVAKGILRHVTEGSIKDSYLNGEITAGKAADMRMEYSGDTAEEAAEKVAYWDFQEDNPQYADLSQSAVIHWYDEAKPAEISLELYYDFMKRKAQCKGVDEDGDGKADSGTVKEEVLALLDSIEGLTYTQWLVLKEIAGV